MSDMLKFPGRMLVWTIATYWCCRSRSAGIDAGVRVATGAWRYGCEVIFVLDGAVAEAGRGSCALDGVGADYRNVESHDR